MRKIYGSSALILAVSFGYLWLLSPAAQPTGPDEAAETSEIDVETLQELQALGLEEHHVWIGDVLWGLMPDFDLGSPFRYSQRPPAEKIAGVGEARPGKGPEDTTVKPPPPPEPIRQALVTIGKDGTFYDGLQKHGFSGKEILDLVAVAKPLTNLGRIKRGTEVELIWNQAVTMQPDTIRIQETAMKYLEMVQGSEGWEAAIKDVETTEVYENYAGEVVSTLWGSARKAGMNPMVIQDLTDIFGWQVDFAREVMVGDRWRLTVAKQMVKDEVISWGPIVAAQYENAGVVFTAIRFAKEGLKEQYFLPDGRSLKSMFLRSPLRFARITSKFSMARFHPVLKVSRPHLGVDYAAPTGTPVRAVGAGVVVDQRFRPTSGNFIKLRHNATYHTAYKHLSRYANGVKPGTRVEQGQVIGYVGSSGLATGPHLHFEFYERGRVIDPLGKKFPSADPLPDEYLESFKEFAAKAIAELPKWSDEQEQQATTLPFEDSAYAGE